MLKNTVCLEVKRGEKLYQFICESSASLGETHDVLHEMKMFIIDQIKKAEPVAESVPSEGVKDASN